MDEIWKPIPGFGDSLEASSLGRIRRKTRIVPKFSALVGRVVDQVYQEKILSPAAGKYGHLSVHIGFDKKKVGLAVHRAVLLAFDGPCPDGMEACHNDGNPANNVPKNLRWDTHWENNQDRKRHGRYAAGSRHPMARLTIEQVRVIRAAPTGKIAAELTGVAYSHCWRIRSGESWSGEG